MNRIDLTKAHWRKSTFSGNSCGDLMEVATVDEHVAVRDGEYRGRGALVFLS